MDDSIYSFSALGIVGEHRENSAKSLGLGVGFDDDLVFGFTIAKNNDHGARDVNAVIVTAVIVVGVADSWTDVFSG